MSDEKKQLWEAYVKMPTMELREKIILEYAGLVKIVAGRLLRSVSAELFWIKLGKWIGCQERFDKSKRK